MNSKRAGCFLIAALLLLTAAPSSGQVPGYLQTGIPPNTTMLKVPLGFVHVINGNVHLEIPIASLPERGGDSDVAKFVYDTTIYTPTDNVGHLSSGPGHGWYLIAENSISAGNVQYDQVGQSCPDPAYPYGQAYKYQNFRYVEANGTVHPTNPNFYTYQINCQDANGNKDWNTGTPTGFNVGDEDGIGYGFNVTNWNQVVMTDVHGNLLNEFYNYQLGVRDTNGNITTSVDTLGRTPVTGGGYCNSTASWTFGIHASSGTNETYTVTCGKYYAINNGWTTPGAFYAPSSLVFPDGTQYTFSYDSGSTGTHYGNLTGVTLREGGVVSFAYTYGYPTSTTSATFGGGTWTLSYYHSGSGSTTQTTTTVTAPSRYDVASHSYVNDKAVYTSVLGGQPFVAAAKFYSGSSTLAKTVSITYGGALTSWPMTVTTTLNDTGQSSKVAYSYGVGLVTLPTEIQEWDYGAGTPTRTQKITYGTLSRPTSVALYAGDGSSGSPIAETTYTYDEYGASYCKNGVPMLTNVTGATNHDDTAYGSTNWTRGNPTTISRLISGTTWSTIHRCYDTLGNVTQEVDARGNPTTYGHLDSFADAACTSTKPTYGYVTSVTNAAGEPTTTKYYSCTGLVQSKTDPNGNIWSYNYDEFGRPTLVHNPDGGETTWSYSGAVSSTENTTLTGSMNLVRTTVLDALGRLSQTPA